jgi:hypothetical protein
VNDGLLSIFLFISPDLLSEILPLFPFLVLLNPPCPSFVS